MNSKKKSLWDRSLGTSKRERQYCFFPGEETIFNVSCLKTIRDFVNDLNIEHHKGIKN